MLSAKNDLLLVTIIRKLNNAARQATQSWHTPTTENENGGMVYCVRGADTYICILIIVAQARKLSRSGSIGRTGWAVKHRAWSTVDDTAIQILSIPFVFWVDRSVLVPFIRSSWFIALTHATVEARHDFLEGGHLRSSIPHPEIDFGGNKRANR